jgi:hypothetical protein
MSLEALIISGVDFREPSNAGLAKLEFRVQALACSFRIAAKRVNSELPKAEFRLTELK